MEAFDDDLRKFEAEGAATLPVADHPGHVEQDGARIWYASYGTGSPVILLHEASVIVVTGVFKFQRW